MDPQACLERIARHYHRSQLEDNDYDGEALDEACENLHIWLSRGGFAPNWEAVDPAVVSYFECQALQLWKKGVK